MASFDVAFQFLMDNEDRARDYEAVPDAPPGAWAISGVNSDAWPDEFDMIRKAKPSERGPLVEAFYQEKFWINAPNGGSWYAQLTSDEVAKRVFDASVNMGSVAAVRCLQEACNSLVLPSMAIATDGKWGPMTIKQTTLCFERDLVAAFQQRRVAHYDALIDANPKLAIYKDAWEARARK